jgi:hypothetical protein
LLDLLKIELWWHGDIKYHFEHLRVHHGNTECYGSTEEGSSNHSFNLHGQVC